MTDWLDKIKESLSHATRIEWTLWTLMLMAVLILIGGAYQIYWPHKAIRIDKIVVSDRVMHRGQVGWFQFQGEKFMPITAHAQVELTDGKSYALMSYDSDNPVGTKFIPRAFIVPYHVVPGKYRIKWTGSYDINPLNTKKYFAYSEEITIN
jgi:hypothetical protein